MQRFVTFSKGRAKRALFLGAHESHNRDFGAVAVKGRDPDDAELWVLTDTGGGRFTIMQASSGRYLDAHQIESLDFLAVTRRRQNDNTQLWRLIGTGEDVRIQQVSSGRVLHRRTDAADFRVVTRPDSGDGAQEWRVRDQFIVTLDRSEEFDTPLAAGSPTACVSPGLDVYNIAYRDTSGRLHELWRDANGATGTTNLTTSVPGGAPRAAGDPFAYVDTVRNTEILLYRGRDDGEVHSLYWSTGAVGHDALSKSAGAPTAAGNPVGYYTPATDTHHVIYRKNNGHLHVLFSNGIEPIQNGGSTTGDSQKAAGDPTAFVGSTGVNWVIYRSPDRRILGLSWKGAGEPFVNDLSGVAGAPKAASDSDPVGHYTAHDDTHQVYYRDGSGNLWELFWQGDAPVQARNLTAATPGAVEATGTPTASYLAKANTDLHHSVAYRSSDGRLHQILWGSRASKPLDLEINKVNNPNPSVPVGRLAGFTVDGAESTHVVYRGVDNHIHEVRLGLPPITALA